MSDFSSLLYRAVSGSHEDLLKILEMYKPLIDRYSYIDDKFDEDLHQYILIRIALNISKFTF